MDFYYYRTPASQRIAVQGGNNYLIDDEFLDTLAAGSVTGTPATPGPGTRTVVDTDGDGVSISGGVLSIANGNSSYGDPGLWLSSIARAAGRVWVTHFNITTKGSLRIGFDTNQSGAPSSDGGVYINGTPIISSMAGNALTAALSTSTDYYLAIVLRAAGYYLFVKGGAFTEWTLLLIESSENGATLYPAHTNYGAAWTSEFVRVPSGLWLPNPIAYTSFPYIELEDQGGVNSLSTGASDTSGVCGVGCATGPDGSAKAIRFYGNGTYLLLGTAAFASWFDPDEGFMLAFGRINTTADWADGSAYRYTVHPKSASDNTKYIVLGRKNEASKWAWRRRDSVNIKEWELASADSLTWHSQALSYSVTADITRAYFDGVQTGEDLAADAMTKSDFNDANSVLGAGNPTQQGWVGDCSNVIIANTAAGSQVTDANVLIIHNAIVAGTLTTTQLDSIFGAGNWIWYKLDETWDTESSGPDSQGLTALAWECGDATWAVSALEAINYTTKGSDLATNGTFAADSDWVKGTGWSIAAGVASHAGGEGNAGDLDADPAPLTAATWYILTYDIASRTEGTLIAKTGGVSGPTRSTNASFTETNRAGSTALVFSANDAFDGDLDNVVIKALTLKSLFCDVDDGLTCNVVAQVEIDTLLAGTQAGLVLNLDSSSTPENFVIAYHDGTNAKLDKYVDGTYTNVISGAATYGAGRILRVVKDGTSYTLYYNEAQIGSTSTISDGGVWHNTKHGLFSTYSGNQLDNFLLMPRGSNDEYADLEQWSGVNP